jgi:FdhD protein
LETHLALDLQEENKHMNTRQYKGLFYRDGRFNEVTDTLAIEVGLSVAINGIPYTVTMQTPGFEKDLVRGLLYSENIYRQPGPHPPMDVTEIDDQGFISGINVRIPEDQILKDFAGTRNVISASSCGLCGKTSLEDDTAQPIVHQGLLDPALVGSMFDQMSDAQQSFRQSGGTHAAGIFTITGELLSLREDIGRHNAVDKTIGDLLNRGILHEARCLTVSGRISYEIVSKARAVGIPFLASVSAPSSLAVETAENCGMTLLAFCRQDKLTAYAHPEHLNMNSPSSTKANNYELAHVEKSK